MKTKYENPIPKSKKKTNNKGFVNLYYYNIKNSIIQLFII